jgi:hypothetical protein
MSKRKLYPLHPFGFGCPEQTYSSCSQAALSIESEGFELFEIEVSEDGGNYY